MLKDYLLNIGYINEEIDTIVKSYTLRFYKEETLVSNIKDIYSYFLSKNYKEKEIHGLIVKSPSILICSKEALESKLKYLNKLGLDGLKITKKDPQVFTYSIDSMNDKIKYLKSIGYTKKNILKTIKNAPEVLGIAIETLKKKQEYFISLGYKEMDVNKLFISFPSLYSINNTTLNTRINYFLSLGYSRQNIISMTISYPELFYLSRENIEKKLNYFKSLGYNDTDILNMTIKLPTLYGLLIETIDDKINFYKDNNLDFIILDDTKQLMQSVRLSYARLMFFKKNNMDINEINYRMLFMGKKRFENKFNLSNEELLDMYPYNNIERNK